MSASPVPSTAIDGAPKFRLGNEKLCKATDAAATKLNSLLTRQGRPAGALRIAVVGGGCSGLQYKWTSWMARPTATSSCARTGSTS